MDKHRPVWARGLSATELDRRQEQARVMNHGQQALLESKLGKLDIREKRSVKDICRQKEDVLLSLHSIKMTSPGLSSMDRHRGGVRSIARSSSCNTKASSSLENSSASGDSPDNDVIENCPSAAKELHLPRLKPQPRASNFNSRRRYSANDALAQSLERFNIYKAGLVKSPSSEIIAENGNSVSRPNTRGSSLTVPPSTPSLNGSIHRSHSWHEDGDLPRPPVKKANLTLRSKKTPVNHGFFPDNEAKNASSDDIETVSLADEETLIRSSTHSNSHRSSNLLHPDAVLVARSKSSQDTQASDEVNDLDNDLQGRPLSELAITVTVPPITDKPLRLLRRKSLAVKPPTPRYLNHRRQSSPEVFIHTMSQRNRLLSLSRQTSTSSASPILYTHRSDDLDLSVKIQNFLQRTDSFIKSSGVDNLPNINPNHASDDEEDE
ncbi:uncharacterized protein [Diadema antillarum]|uniref:uncharacterized protein n=1 Tax=Diadema antillarum TaxID=105358 RepID=UPI003A842F20